LELAREAYAKGSVPIGALIVNRMSQIIAEGFNEIKISNDPTAHAEIVCMRKAGKDIIKKLNPDKTNLYTTLEPCPACAFFVTRTNILNIIWALKDPYKGGVELLKQSHRWTDEFEKITLISEPEEDIKTESKRLMREYYLNKAQNDVAQLFS